MIHRRVVALAVCVLLLTASYIAQANLISTTSYQFSATPDAGCSGNVSQTISTTPGELYQISFDAYMSAVYTPTTLNFLFGDVLNQSLVGDLGQQYYRWYFGQTSSSLATFNYFVTANSASTTLAFEYAMTSENYGMAIRNLSVSRVPDATSTAALLSVAGTGLFFTRRWLNRSR